MVIPAPGLIKLTAAESRTLMDKCRPSRKQHARPSRRPYLLVLLPITWMIPLWPQISCGINLSHSDVQKIGKRIWQNECNGTISGLTSWNEGEDFASLGIGHFIWYPKGRRGPFEESFPKVVSFISKRGAKLPDTIDLQAEFLISRLEGALPKMLDEAAPAQRGNVQQQFDRLARTQQGCYAIVDYVNFKGEGVLHTERYQGQGWGLLQVLESMHGTGDADAVDEFARAARATLTRRVHNAPAGRHESRWLTGWIRRVNSYNGG